MLIIANSDSDNHKKIFDHIFQLLGYIIVGIIVTGEKVKCFPTSRELLTHGSAFKLRSRRYSNVHNCNWCSEDRAR